MKERGIPEAVKKILRPAIRDRYNRSDDCDGCELPLGNQLRRKVVTFTATGSRERPYKAAFFIQHRSCFDSGVPVVERGIIDGS